MTPEEDNTDISQKLLIEAWREYAPASIVGNLTRLMITPGDLRYFPGLFYFVASADGAVAPNFGCNTFFTSSCFLANLHDIVNSVTRINPKDNQNQKLSLHLLYTCVKVRDNVEEKMYSKLKEIDRHKLSLQNSEREMCQMIGARIHAGDFQS